VATILLIDHKKAHYK